MCATSRKINKYKAIFDNIPTAVLELDYTPLLELRQQLQAQTVTNYRQFLSENPGLLRKTFRKVRLIDANPAAYELYGTRSKIQLMEQFSRTLTTTAIDLLTEHFVCLLDGDKGFSGEFKYKTVKRRFIDVFFKTSVLRGAKGRVERVIVTLQDITPWKRLERQLRKKAQLDGLTGLLNHTTIMQRLSEELIRARRYGLSLSVLMIDLDHFKVINDKFGHQRGDMVLKKVAVMIRDCVRTVDLVGRYGGDEFLLIFPETRPQNAKYAAQRIQGLFARKNFKYQKIIQFNIALSIGITGYPAKKVRDPKDMISLADKAMYSAKKTGRNRIAII